MHLPDAFLDAKTTALSAAAAVTGVSIALRRLRTSLEPRQVPLLGLAGAFVFAAQMLNFPVIGGTSGHLIGGVLAAVLLGPSAAIVVITCVLIVQCLMFSDGGLLAIGANTFNMALVSVCGGYAAFWLSRKMVPMETQRSMVFAAAFSAWLGTVLASISCAGQLALSGTAPWSLAFPAMAGIHMLIGIGEGLATGLILLAVLRTRPELIRAAAPDHRPHLPSLAGFGLIVALGLAVLVAPFASPLPDGLERVAENLGFANKAVAASLVPSPMPNYELLWMGSPTFGTAVAGFVGTVLAFVASYVFARIAVPLGRPTPKA